MAYSIAKTLLGAFPRSTLTLLRQMSAVPALIPDQSDEDSHVDYVKPRTKATQPVEVENFLKDTFGRKHSYLRISLTERCNLRCTYCMPAEGVKLTKKDNLLSSEEIIRVAKVFVSGGVRKIRLTGGEPLLRQDIEELIASLKALPGMEEIALTTNGILLKRKLASLIKAGLDSINVSLDTLVPVKFELIARRLGWEKVIDSIDASIEAGFVPLKVNCVVTRGVNEDEITDFVKWTEKKAVDIRFIEYMPFGGNKWTDKKIVPYFEMLDIIKRKFPTVVRLKDKPNDTSKAYQVPGHIGQFGFISSMTDNFCGSCNRLRLTADGNLKVCLFGNSEVSLRDVLRSGVSDEDLKEVIGAAVTRKKKQHAGPDSFSRYLTRQSFRFQHSSPSYTSSTRSYSTGEFSHINPRDGKASMVSVTDKAVTHRIARAQSRIAVGEVIFQKILANEVKKGDVLATAKLAGIAAAKKTWDLIPLCHNIPLDVIRVNHEFIHDTHEIVFLTTAECTWKTGVEMEALTAAAVAALTVYDMCKALSHDMIIGEVRLLHKSGGSRPAFNCVT